MPVADFRTRQAPEGDARVSDGPGGYAARRVGKDLSSGLSNLVPTGRLSTASGVLSWKSPPAAARPGSPEDSSAEGKPSRRIQTRIAGSMTSEVNRQQVTPRASTRPRLCNPWWLAIIRLPNPTIVVSDVNMIDVDVEGLIR